MPMCPCNDPPRNREVPPPSRNWRALRVAVLLSGAVFHAPLALAQAREARVHPAVVRVIVDDKSGRSHGSGALVAVTESFGLVLTNWHVVRDAAAPPTVVFPDGFRSAAAIARVDRDWDLAALVIWQPRADPIPLAARPPRPGEPLAIAGYGPGQYRVATGRCTQYLSPGRRHPFELVELTASARQGDSGGPIFNERGELAGVLFGSAFGRTTGSHSGRVRQFLAPLWHDFYERPDTDTLIAARPGPDPPVASIRGVRPAAAPPDHGGRPARSPAAAPPRNVGGSPVAGSGSAAASPPPAVSERPAVAAAPSSGGAAAPAAPWEPAGRAGDLSRQPPTAVPPVAVAVPGSGGPATGNPATGGPVTPAPVEPWAAGPGIPENESSPPDLPARSEQLKTILAAIGVLALVFHGVRLLGRAVEV